MNMKKTIAAIAAGAVAVSAMATTTSALAAKTLTYNLVKTTKNQDAAGTVTATFTNVPLEAGGTLVIDPIAGNSWNTIVTISGSFWDDAAGVNKSFTPVVATGMDWETGYSIEGSRLWQDQAFSDHGTVNVPVVASTAAGTNVALKATSSAVITVTVKYTDLPDSVSYAGALNGLIKEGKRGIKISSIGSAGSTAAGLAAPTYTTSGGTAKAIRVVDQSAVNELAGLNMQYDQATYTWKTMPSDTIEVTGFTLQYNGAPVICNYDNLTKAGVTIAAAGSMQGQSWANGSYTFGVDTVNSAFINASDGSTAWQFTYAYSPAAGWTVGMTGNTVTINFTAGSQAPNVDMTAKVNQAFSFVQIVEDDDILKVSQPTGGANGALYASDLSGAALETSANSETKKPYHSTLGNKTITNFNQGWYDGDVDNIFGNVGSGNVITWIGYASDDNKTWATEDHQAVSNAIMSVINDAVQNYNDVVFTFNTATKNVEITRNNKGEITDYKYTDDGVKGREWDKDNNYSKEIVNYTAFGRHYWDKETGYDPTMYITNDWLGNNLFEGALIINNNLTLSLGATDKFDWTATSLSFSWDAIQDAALTQNQYANYIQTMVLRTSTDWFWDNITVELGETEVEEVDSGAPVEGDTEDLPEDEEDGIDFEEEEEEEEEPEVDVEPEPEVAPVEVASNPGTGNAPVALAVIPVALAAAAIVAKKRG